MPLRNPDRRRFLLALGIGLALPRRSFGHIEPEVAVENEEVPWQTLAEKGHVFEHWTPEHDSRWEWYRLERYLDRQWETVRISRPINSESGEPFEPQDGYLALDDVPLHVREGELPELAEALRSGMAPSQYDPSTAMLREPDSEVQAREGRPASDWLRSLWAAELRDWLPTRELPEAGVSGMTFWVHLVRDHGFDPRRIDGLTEAEFLLLHSAAHHGL